MEDDQTIRNNESTFNQKEESDNITLSKTSLWKLSTIVLFNDLHLKEVDSNIILHVHDELVLELKEKDKEAIEKIVKDSMENCIKLKVGLKVDINTSSDWYI